MRIQSLLLRMHPLIKAAGHIRLASCPCMFTARAPAPAPLQQPQQSPQHKTCRSVVGAEPLPLHPVGLQVVAIGTDDKACKALEKSYKERVTTAVCDAKDIKQVKQPSHFVTLFCW